MSIPANYDLIATIAPMNGAYLLDYDELWTSDSHCAIEGGAEAWGSLAKCKRSLHEAFGAVRYEPTGSGLIFVYANIRSDTE